MIALFTNLHMFSQTCCSGGIPLSNSIGLPVSGKGAFLLGLSYDYNYLNTLKSGNDVLDDRVRERTTQSLLLNLGYTITRDLSVEALFTYVKQERIISIFGNVNKDGSNGIGDGVILFKYNFNELFKKNNLLRIGLGTKIPIGATDKKSDQGILLNPDLQPGSGAWDLIGWSFYSQTFSFRPSGTFSATVVYRYTGTNNNFLNGNTTYRFGPEFQAFVNYTDQFLVGKNLINPGLSVNYRNAEQDEIGGSLLDNTGGEWVNLIPTVNFEIIEDLNFLLKIEIPIYSYVDGTQLTPTYRITTGLFYSIDRKNKKNQNPIPIHATN